jgi:transposase-like protein
MQECYRPVETSRGNYRKNCTQEEDKGNKQRRQKKIGQFQHILDKKKTGG